MGVIRQNILQKLYDFKKAGRKNVNMGEIAPKGEEEAYQRVARELYDEGLITATEHEWIDDIPELSSMGITDDGVDYLKNQ